MIDRDTMMELMSDSESLVLPGHDAAIIGVGTRCGEPAVAIYDRDLLLAELMEKNSWSVEDADEWICFNIEGAWLGKKTPIIMENVEELN